MNIKNPETQMLARELAKLTGETLTTAITEALRDRLERVKSQNEPALIARWLAIGKRNREIIPEPYLSIDHADLLYDEFGLPK